MHMYEARMCGCRQGVWSMCDNVQSWQRDRLGQAVCVQAT
jgi:hypothetical protein